MKDNSEKKYEPILLKRNVTFPTYQLHAFAGNGTVSPEDVMKIAVLETMEWLRKRFRAFDVPKELNMPCSEQYKDVSFDDFSSFQIDMGYKLVVIFLPEERVWTLQLTEPDQGVAPNAGNLGRMPVAGRIFETNISFRLEENTVECGFLTVVHEMEGTTAPCEVFRMACVKYLARNVKVGLRQQWQLKDSANTLSDAGDIRRFCKWADDYARSLPIVLFSECELQKETSVAKKSSLTPLQKFNPEFLLNGKTSLSFALPTTPEVSKPTLPLAIDDIVRYKMGYAQFFVVPAAQLAMFNQVAEQTICGGDILVIEPPVFGKHVHHFSGTEAIKKPDETLKRIDDFIQNYLKGKAIEFGNCIFVPKAAELERQAIITLHKSKEEMANAFLEEKRLLETTQNKKNVDYNKEVLDLEKRISDKTDEIAHLKRELESVRKDAEKMLLENDKKIREQEMVINYYRALDNRPSKKEEVPDWVKQKFDGRLIIHKKGEDRLLDTPSETIDIKLLCDALEFLATEYRESILGNISKDDCDKRAFMKYGRTFYITPISEYTINSFPNDYKIKYYEGYKGKLIESGLDLHLSVGNTYPHMLRIYFLFDKVKKIIVVGSLPQHLHTVANL